MSGIFYGRADSIAPPLPPMTPDQTNRGTRAADEQARQSANAEPEQKRQDSDRRQEQRQAGSSGDETESEDIGQTVEALANRGDAKKAAANAYWQSLAHEAGRASETPDRRQEQQQADSGSNETESEDIERTVEQGRTVHSRQHRAHRLRR